MVIRQGTPSALYTVPLKTGPILYSRVEMKKVKLCDTFKGHSVLFYGFTNLYLIRSLVCAHVQLRGLSPNTSPISYGSMLDAAVPCIWCGLLRRLRLPIGL